MNSDTIAIIALIVSIASIPISIFTAKRYGDVAGTNAAIEFEANKEAAARKSLGFSLFYEIVRVRDFARENTRMQGDIAPFVKIPLTFLERAFLSSDSFLIDFGAENQDFFQIMNEFFALAEELNSLIDMRMRMVDKVNTNSQIATMHSQAADSLVSKSARIEILMQELIDTFTNSELLSDNLK